MIGDFLDEDITYRRASGFDSHGQPSWGSSATAKGRVRWKMRQILTTEGKTVNSIGSVLMDADSPVSPGDQVLLEGRWYEVIEIGRPRGDGYGFARVTLGGVRGRA